MTDTSNGYRALPWHSDGYRVFDEDGIEVANTYTPDLALSSAKAVAKDIVAAVNAHYGDTVAAEADLSYYKTASKNFEDSYWEANKRAEAAEKRAEQAEIDRSELLKYYERYQEAAEAAIDEMYETEKFAAAMRERARKAEARVRELEREYYLKARSVGFGWQVKADPDTFTATDGRVFRVGQRVWHIWDEPGEFGHVTDINGGFPLVQFQDSEDQTHPDNLRRVWDGSEEPDVPVGTVLRDSYGCYLERLSGTRWELQNEKGDPLDNDEWVNLDGEQFRPYVEVLPGDDE